MKLTLICALFLSFNLFAKGLPVQVEFQSQDKTKLSGLMGITQEHKAAVLIFHGMQSHSEWHKPMVEALNANGIDAFVFDRRGSGKSGGVRGHFDRASQLVQDAEAAYKEFKKHIPAGTPMHVYGTSFGYFSSVPFVVKHQSELKSYMLVVPAVASAKSGDYPLSIKAKILFSPSLKRYNPPYPAVYIAGEQALTKINQDTLVNKTFTAQFMRNALLMRMSANSDFSKIKLPTLVVGASHDKIIDTASVKKKLLEKNQARVKYVEFNSEHDIGMAGQEEALQNTILEWLLN